MTYLLTKFKFIIMFVLSYICFNISVQMYMFEKVKNNYMHMSAYVDKCVCVHVCVCICVHVCMSMHVYLYVCCHMCMGMHVCTDVCVSANRYICSAYMKKRYQCMYAFLNI